MKRRYSKSLGRRTHGNPDVPISTLSEEESLERLDSLGHDPFILALDQVQDPRNLGACLRSADGAGIDLVILPNDRSSGLTEVVRHVACGAAEKLPIARVVNLARYMDKLSSMGIRLIGTSDQATQSVWVSFDGGETIQGLNLGNYYVSVEDVLIEGETMPFFQTSPEGGCWFAADPEACYNETYGP